ncbi:hypothetical protein ABZV91_15075 [Nocardia sp. NPDC004568]|uniref:hypothetical protein n=1 Tax=Nocardia sp. NPDC004568 TaxID=3154551 RepID=UPI0033A3217B
MSIFQQQPDDMRTSGSRDHGEVPGLLDRAADDPEWEAALYRGAGYGVHAYALAAREIRRARTANWTYTADKYQGSGDTKLGGATTFENADADGGARVDPGAADV